MNLERMLKLAGLNEAQATPMSSDQLLRLLTDAIDDMAKQAIHQLYEADPAKLAKLRALAYHENTPPGEKAAALAALHRLQPPPPPPPEAPEGGYVSKGKVFSPGPVEPTGDQSPSKPAYTTMRGKSFS
jgi:hypothetical protein